MTDWLDPRTVQELKEISDYGIDTAAQRERDKGFAMSVLEAIAALPEPKHNSMCECHSDPCQAANALDELIRIWSIARVVTGQEDAGA